MSYSELEAINFLLSHVGAAPVPNLATPLPDILSAQLRLNEASIWVQKKGWWFNRLIRQVFEPDEITDEIDLPENTLKVIGQWPQFVIERDDKAYNPHEDSFEFQQSLCLDVILELDWEQLPPSAQDAILYRAAKTMVLHELEDANKVSLLERDADEAYVLLKQEDLQIRQRHVATLPAVQKLLHKVRPYRRYNVRNPNVPGGGL